MSGLSSPVGAQPGPAGTRATSKWQLRRSRYGGPGAIGLPPRERMIAWDRDGATGVTGHDARSESQAWKAETILGFLRDATRTQGPRAAR